LNFCPFLEVVEWVDLADKTKIETLDNKGNGRFGILIVFCCQNCLNRSRHYLSGQVMELIPTLRIGTG
jgi:hypothetical protein